ncbi:MAG TPA: carbohydrate ABC transporter permease, partial [Candidatus Sumerlaeota bacterium]|nr:carbohydrate ABC transporter permease [Candidatus Sumerlaeota bacterium]
VVALFQFMGTWNDFLGPLIYLPDESTFTLAIGLQFFQSQHGGTQWNLLMAASTLVILPVIILFFFTQKSFIEGISLTGLKG